MNNMIVKSLKDLPEITRLNVEEYEELKGYGGIFYGRKCIDRRKKCAINAYIKYIAVNKNFENVAFFHLDNKCTDITDTLVKKVFLQSNLDCHFYCTSNGIICIVDQKDDILILILNENIYSIIKLTDLFKDNIYFNYSNSYVIKKISDNEIFLVNDYYDKSISIPIYMELDFFNLDFSPIKLHIKKNKCDERECEIYMDSNCRNIEVIQKYNILLRFRKKCIYLNPISSGLTKLEKVGINAFVSNTKLLLRSGKIKYTNCIGKKIKSQARINIDYVCSFVFPNGVIGLMNRKKHCCYFTLDFENFSKLDYSKFVGTEKAVDIRFIDNNICLYYCDTNTILSKIFFEFNFIDIFQNPLIASYYEE